MAVVKMDVSRRGEEGGVRGRGGGRREGGGGEEEWTNSLQILAALTLACDPLACLDSETLHRSHAAAGKWFPRPHTHARRALANSYSVLRVRTFSNKT